MISGNLPAYNLWGMVKFHIGGIVRAAKMPDRVRFSDRR